MNENTLKENKIMETVLSHKLHLEQMGYTVAFIGLYGSQNYGLDIYTDEYQSDVDTKTIIVPTLEDLVMNSKPVSTTIEIGDGQCDVKDIRTFFETFTKANPAYLEVLFSKYYFINKKFENEFKEMIEKREELVYTLRYQMIRAMYGMILQKEKALKHPYPSIKDKIDKYKFDGKQLHHIIRLYDMMNDYFVDGKGFKISMYSGEDNKDLLFDCKLNKIGLEEAERLCKDYVLAAKNLKNSILESSEENVLDYSVRDEFINLSRKIIINKIKDEISLEAKLKEM